MLTDLGRQILPFKLGQVFDVPKIVRPVVLVLAACATPVQLQIGSGVPCGPCSCRRCRRAAPPRVAQPIDTVLTCPAQPFHLRPFMLRPVPRSPSRWAVSTACPLQGSPRVPAAHGNSIGYLRVHNTMGYFRVLAGSEWPCLTRRPWWMPRQGDGTWSAGADVGTPGGDVPGSSKLGPRGSLLSCGMQRDTCHNPCNMTSVVQQRGRKQLGTAEGSMNTARACHGNS